MEDFKDTVMIYSAAIFIFILPAILLFIFVKIAGIELIINTVE